MHGDEAVHAYRFGQLLETNNYRYDPTEYHGPALNYFTLIPALFSGHHTYASLTEITLRIVPVFFGLILILLPLLIFDGIGKPAAFVAILFTAISPAFVFYSRYYIPEMLLVCFTFGMIACGYRYIKNQSWTWALRTGILAGLCFATKETSVIAFGAVVISLAIVIVSSKGTAQLFSLFRMRHLILAISGALFIWGLFFSSFLKNPQGLIDSFGAFGTYFNRAGTNQFHIHPWYYYFQLLVYNKVEGSAPWTEGFIVILSIIGLLFIFNKREIPGVDYNLLKFLAIYAIIMTLIYCAIPYKTPWCLLNFYQALILVAAIGVIAIWRMIEQFISNINLKTFLRFPSRVLASCFFATFTIDIGLQAFVGNFYSYTSLSNPYVYAHPTKDVLVIAYRVEEVSRDNPMGHDMPVWVVCPGSDYWPLPWYLRAFKNAGYYNDVNEIKSAAPLVIASAEIQEKLISRLFEISPPGQKNLYLPLFERGIELRPAVEIKGYITKDLWDSRQANKTD